MTDSGRACELTKIEIGSYTLPYCVKNKKEKYCF